MTDFRVDIDAKGPLWNGMAERAKDDFLRETVWEIAKEGRGDLGVQFIRVFREPTGYYESQVEAVRPVMDAGSPVARVHDNSVIYGWWLEGIGSRNYPVTRFRGYHSFRIVAQELQRKAVSIAQRVLQRRFLQRMGGRSGA